MPKCLAADPLYMYLVMCSCTVNPSVAFSVAHLLQENLLAEESDSIAEPDCKIFGPYSNQPEQDPFLLLNSRIHSVCGSRG